ncbi:MAG: hypothetical protein ABI760_25665 [Ferruginibacter sp.]
MKYLLASLLITLLASTFCIDYTFSQSGTKNPGFQKTNESSSFTFGDLLANPLRDGSLVEKRVSQLALTAFRNSFQNVTYSKWYRVRRDYLVYFKANENVSRALYDVRGNLISSFFYGSEKDLPSAVKDLVKTKYPDYDILVTIEVYQADRKIWVVNLCNDKSLVSVSVYNDFIQVISRNRKSK